MMQSLLKALCATLVFTASLSAQATSLGFTQLPANAQTPEITLFYPSSSATTTVKKGPFTLELAVDGAWEASNTPRRLLVISHGSGGAPWPLVDLARTFAQAGYAVALPTHAGDNHRDMRLEGPESWKLRPLEVSRTLDALAAHPRYGTLIDTQRVGVYGTSAGGLNAIVLAGGHWSSGHYMRHCLQQMEQDFHACVGLATHLRGNALDGIKLAVARAEHRRRFDDDSVQRHHEPRIAAAAASVPMAAPFLPASLAALRTPLGIIQAGQDEWLHPRFHSQALLRSCATAPTPCTLIADLPQASHGSLFSPWPQELAASLTPLLVDPPGFERSSLPQVYAKLLAFFSQHLSAPQ